MLAIPASVFLVFIVLVILVKKWKASGKNLPPGPPKVPLIGNLLHLSGSLLPHHTITALANKYGPVMHLQLGEVIAVVVSSAEAAKVVLKTNELSFAQRPIVLAIDIVSYKDSSIVFAPYGDYWRQIRKVCVFELLSAKRVQSFRRIREEEAWNLMQSISSSEGVAVNLSNMMFSMTNDITSRAAFSQKCKDQSEFIELIREMVELTGGFNLAELYPSLKFLRYATGIQSAVQKVHNKIKKIANEIIEEHRAKRKSSASSDSHDREDFIDVLLRLQESNQLDVPLTNNTITSLTLEIFGAGGDTTSTAMEWAMAELIKNPRVMHKAQAEVRQVLKGKTKIEEADLQKLEYLRLVIKETLRMHPPVPLQGREALEDCELGGYKIPAKAKVLINVWAICRDPKIWVEPDCFKPERFQNSEIDYKGSSLELTPFGAGRRICPGISFATANIEFALAQLIYHFDWTLPGGTKLEELDMSEIFGATARKKHNLELVPTVRVPFSG